MPAEFSGVLEHPIAVLVVDYANIALPLEKNEQTETEAEGEDDEVSSYLSKKGHMTATLPKFDFNNNKRIAKLSLTDGVSDFDALEYEPLLKLKEIGTGALLLALKPPIQVRKGLLLLKPENCEV
eukprot:CAMPEP_0170471032 /NCGR_PEP_ID=MMETSP0123-20130129/13346_1 /TAXON_ID=182087 /ORGANISM="Favella ehrenbergii, Strain Fehren 1" /LENGTH=124 /DNA_ID=CAMNT_0010738463 /DNA_START=154 /DNA_END=525 /DNA_ORIENTATION=-